MGWPWQMRIFGTHPRVFKALGLTTGFLCFVATGSIDVISAYAASIKSQYNLTQSQVDLVASVAQLGVDFGYPVGFVMEKLGIGGSLTIGLLLTCASSTMIWYSARMIDYYSGKIALLTIYFFLYGFGIMFSQKTLMTVNMGNAKSNNRGKVMALFVSGYNAGASALSLVYFLYYTPDNSLSEGDLEAFFLLTTLLLAVGAGIAILFAGDFSFLVTKEAEEGYSFLEPQSPEAADRAVWPPPRKLKEKFTWASYFRQLAFLADVDYQMMTWGFVLLVGMTMSYRINVTFYLQSLGHADQSAAVTVLQPIIAIIALFSVSIPSDYYIAEVPRALILLMFSVLLLFTHVASFWLLDNLAFFYVYLVVVHFADGAAWTLVPTMLTEYFGMENFSRGWGICTILMGLGSLAFSEVFGVLYDIALPEDSPTETCYGMGCFVAITWFFWAVLVCTVVFFGILSYRAIDRMRLKGPDLSDSDPLKLLRRSSSVDEDTKYNYLTDEQMDLLTEQKVVR